MVTETSVDPDKDQNKHVKIPLSIKGISDYSDDPNKDGILVNVKVGMYGDEDQDKEVEASVDIKTMLKMVKTKIEKKEHQLILV